MEKEVIVTNGNVALVRTDRYFYVPTRKMENGEWDLGFARTYLLTEMQSAMEEYLRRVNSALSKAERIVSSVALYAHDAMDDDAKETMRAYVDAAFWDRLNIQEKKNYCVKRLVVKKTSYTEVYVAIPLDSNGNEEDDEVDIVECNEPYIDFDNDEEVEITESVVVHNSIRGSEIREECLNEADIED